MQRKTEVYKEKCKQKGEKNCSYSHSGAEPEI